MCHHSICYETQRRKSSQNHAESSWSSVVSESSSFSTCRQWGNNTVSNVLKGICTVCLCMTWKIHKRCQQKLLDLSTMRSARLECQLKCRSVTHDGHWSPFPLRPATCDYCPLAVIACTWYAPFPATPGDCLRQNLQTGQTIDVVGRGSSGFETWSDNNRHGQVFVSHRRWHHTLGCVEDSSLYLYVVSWWARHWRVAISINQSHHMHNQSPLLYFKTLSLTRTHILTLTSTLPG